MGSKKDKQFLYITVCIAVGVLLIIGIVLYMKSNDKGKSSSPPLPPPKPENKPPPPNPNHETKVNLEDEIDPNKPAIVMFYASWCGPSKAALPEWQKLEQALRGSPVQAISFEDSTSKKEIMENGVKGYPTIRLYPEGYPNMNFIEYQGPRMFDHLFNFVKNGGKM